MFEKHPPTQYSDSFLSNEGVELTLITILATPAIHSTMCDFHNFGPVFAGQCTVCLKG